MRGFSLVELLVATTLMATLVTGGIAAWTQVQGAAREAAARLDLRERATFALGTLETELQMAGYFGFRPPRTDAGQAIAAASSTCGMSLLRELPRGVEVRPAYDLDCAPFAGGALPGAPVLVIRRASPRPAAPEAGRIQWYSDPRVAAADGLIQDGRAPALPGGAAAAGLLHHLQVRAFYLARASDGDPATPSLRVKSLTRVAGRPMFVDTEVMPGVDAMQITLQPGAAPHPLVQVRLGLSTATSGPAAAAAPRLSATRWLAMRNLAPH